MHGMGGEDKIVGLTRKSVEEPLPRLAIEPPEAAAEDARAESPAVPATDAAALPVPNWSDETETIGQGTARAAWISAILALGWTGFFAWANWPSLANGVSPAEARDLIVGWAVPMTLIVAVHILMLRSSTAEARRFAAITQALQQESSALANRLVTVNGELSLAREFLANQSQELESLSRISTDRLTRYGEELQALISGSDQGMRAIGEISEAASTNMEKLRTHLPVIANSARDLTNQIGNAGRSAQMQINEMIGAFQKLNEFGQAADRQVTALAERASESSATLNAASETMGAQMEAAAAAIDANGARAAKMIADASDTLRLSLTQACDALDARVIASEDRIGTARVTLEAGFGDLAGAAEALEGRIGAMHASVAATAERAGSDLDALDTKAGAALGQIDQALGTIDAKAEALRAQLDQGQDSAARFTEQAEGLQRLMEDNRLMLGEALPAALSALDARVEASTAALAALRPEVDALDSVGAKLAAMIADIEARLGEQRSALADLAEHHDAGWTTRSEAIGTLIGQMREARGEAEALAQDAETRLSETLRAITVAAQDAAGETRRRLDAAIGETSEQFGQETSETLERIVRTRAEQIVGKLDAAMNRAVGATTEATLHLRDQLVKVDELTTHLEQRVADARERAEERTDNDFARRVALLTESLNSAAIDIAKIMASEVSDTAWSAYLRGDRGVFTRRAVRLLDAAEAKEIGQLYETDPVFYDQVNRFVHDFEAMLRSVLSTRDGGVIGVTLLSSDMGKLYVALAQAIERFRA